MKRQIPFAKKQRQLKHCIKLIKKSSDKNSIIYTDLVAKTRKLFEELRSRLSIKFFRKTYAAASFSILLGLGGINAQNFSAPISSPFGLSPNGNFTNLAIGDLDNDGTLDVLVTASGNNFLFFENSGTTSQAVFGTSVNNPFSLITNSDYPAAVLVDIDDDGDLDMFLDDSQYTGFNGSYNYGTNYSYYYSYNYSNGKFKFYENTGTASTPNFSNSVINPFGLNPNFATSQHKPSFVDIDGDGDLDMITGAQYYYYAYNQFFGFYNYAASNNILFYENIGTSTSPSFASPLLDPFNIDLSRNGASTDFRDLSTTFSDLDNDGDMDLLIGMFHIESNSNTPSNVLMYFENIGTSTAPDFNTGVVNPFNLTMPTSSEFTPEFLDLDGDGDDDIIMGSRMEGIFYFENLGNPSSVQEIEADFSLRTYPNPVQSTLSLKFENHTVSENVEINIHSMQGRLLYRELTTAVGNGIIEIPVESFSSGMYVVKVSINNRIRTLQFIKE